MKKSIIFALAAFLMLAGACDAATSSEDDVSSSGNATETTAPVLTGEISQEDLVFVYEGVRYELNSDVAPLLEVFGPDYELVAAPSCAHEGDDKNITYDFVYIYTYPDGEIDRINEVHIYDGKHIGPRGVGIGDTIEDVLAAYENEHMLDDAIVYSLTGNYEDLKSPKLYFEFDENNVITALIYYAANNI